MKKFTGLKVLALAVAAGVLATPAWATLEVDYGGTVSGGTISGGTVCIDNAACDLNSAVGVVSVSSPTLGTLTISSLGGTSQSPNGVISFNLNATATVGSGTFTFAVTDNMFTNPAPPNLSLGASITGNSAPGGSGVTGNLSAVGYFGANNVLFNTSGTSTTTASTTLGGAQGSGTAGPINSGNPYSLTDFVTVTLTGLGTSNDKTFQVGSSLDTAAASVPEPASVSLLGGVLLLTAGAIRRKIRRA